MKYSKTVERILSGTMSSADLLKCRENAKARFAKGDSDAWEVVKAVNMAKPKDKRIIFMGFCPSADINNRRDIEWRRDKVCRFTKTESERQRTLFEEILPGDLIVLKKRQKFGETMRLFGYGRVKSAKYDENGELYYDVDWSDQEDVIEVPLMGLHATVNVVPIDRVEKNMPSEFFDWLEGAKVKHIKVEGVKLAHAV